MSDIVARVFKSVREQLCVKWCKVNLYQCLDGFDRTTLWHICLLHHAERCYVFILGSSRIWSGGRGADCMSKAQLWLSSVKNVGAIDLSVTQLKSFNPFGVESPDGA